MLESATVRSLDISADELVGKLLTLARSEPVAILDSCGVGYLDSHLLIAGILPIEAQEISDPSGEQVLAEFEKAHEGDEAVIFTLSYDLGRKLLGMATRHERRDEPDAYIARFPALVVHDYRNATTRIVGDEGQFDAIQDRIREAVPFVSVEPPPVEVNSNFSRSEYLQAVASIQERIRCGDTYQTNLTHQLTARLDERVTPQSIFARLRRDHRPPFSAFIERENSTVVSASPERFFSVAKNRITTSPIKGTRPRGITPDEDARLETELLTSRKDFAENTMIVDLLRNDLGRVCEFGSVRVEKLCDLEEHPTFFHLVSTISGELRNDASIADILRAVFPCGSITGAPKISTMRIIDEIETAPRGLSMGAIGYYIPEDRFGFAETLDLSVAIRTMTIRDNVATFNVGGGITIDSEPEAEWD